MKKTKGFTMPHQISIIDPERMMRMWKKNRWMRPERVMALGFLALIVPVSYTHLDVYKRQA